jgi:hypothetical protein
MKACHSLPFCRSPSVPTRRRRHPEWGLGHRRLMHRIDPAAGTIELDGVIYPLKDVHLPTPRPARRSGMSGAAAHFLSGQPKVGGSCALDDSARAHASGS